MSSYWTVLQTRTGWETGLKRRLDRDGYSYSHPLIQLDIISYGRRRTRIEPMFPGYLFLRLRDGTEELSAQRWSPAEQLPGAIKILKIDGKPVRLQDAFVNDIEATLVNMVRGGHTDRVLPPAPRSARFMPRQMIKITEGPYVGYGAQFSHMTGPERCKVLLAMFGRPTEVDIAVDQLEAA